jgi:hypothetical protein
VEIIRLRRLRDDIFEGMKTLKVTTEASWSTAAARCSPTWARMRLLEVIDLSKIDEGA